MGIDRNILGPTSTFSLANVNASFHSPHHCSEKTTAWTQVGIAWPPLRLQENAPECTGFITALAKHQHMAAARGTAQPAAQWRGREVVNLPLQVFINFLLI